MGVGGGIRELARHQGLRGLRGTHISEAPKVHPAWPDPAGPPHTPEGSPVDSLSGLPWVSMGRRQGQPSSEGKKPKGRSAHGPPWPASCPDTQTPGGQVRAPVHPGPGPAPGTGRGAGEHPQGAQQSGGWGRKDRPASRPLINANKYANGGSRTALLTFQFNSSNPGGESL